MCKRVETSDCLFHQPQQRSWSANKDLDTIQQLYCCLFSHEHTRMSQSVVYNEWSLTYLPLNGSVGTATSGEEYIMLLFTACSKVKLRGRGRGRGKGQPANVKQKFALLTKRVPRDGLLSRYSQRKFQSSSHLWPSGRRRLKGNQRQGGVLA